MLENVRLSFQGIWSHKMRSFLTMLGIIIGIAAIISIVSTIKGTNEEIKNSLIGAGNNAVNIQINQQGYPLTIYSSSDIPFGIPEVTEETKQAILDLDSVENMTSYKERQSPDSIFYLDKAMSSGCIRGIDTSYFETAGYVIKTGRNFVDEDYTEFRKVLIIDTNAAKALFEDESPIGKTIEIGKQPYTVIGVAAQVNTYEPTITNLTQYDSYASSKISYLFMPKTCWPISYSYDEPENVIVKAMSTDDMENAGQSAEKILNATISSSQTSVKYKADNLLEQARNMQKLSAATNNQLIWIASISLLVGGIGVMNIMLVSVTERTREIGLKKAIGARKKVILFQFLTEASMLTSIGGVIGVIVGIILSKVVSQLSGAPTAISVPAIIGSVLFSTLIGVIFGLLPSVKAADLNPIDALRSE